MKHNDIQALTAGVTVEEHDNTDYLLSKGQVWSLGSTIVWQFKDDSHYLIKANFFKGIRNTRPGCHLNF